MPIVTDADVYLIDNTLQVITVEQMNIFGDCIAVSLKAVVL